MSNFERSEMDYQRNNVLRMVQQQQHQTLLELKRRKADSDQKRQYLKGLIQRNRELKHRSHTIREYAHLIKKNQEIRFKI